MGLRTLRRCLIRILGQILRRASPSTGPRALYGMGQSGDRMAGCLFFSHVLFVDED